MAAFWVRAGGVDLWKPRPQVFLGCRRSVGLEACRVQ
jgi:hypothetical protein